MDGCLRSALCGLWMLALGVAISSRGLAAEPQAPTRVATLAFIESDGTRQSVVEVLSTGEVRAIELRGTRANRVETVRVDSLQREELLGLQTELVTDLDLSTLTSSDLIKSLHAASETRQLSHEIEGAAETEIGLRVGTQWHTIRCPAAALLAVRFPECPEVAAVASAQARLQNLAAVALLGGGEVADRYARDATQKLHETHPDAGALTRRDLAMVRRLADGSSFLQFRSSGNAQGQTACLVSLTHARSGPARVSILQTPTVVR